MYLRHISCIKDETGKNELERRERRRRKRGREREREIQIQTGLRLTYEA